MSPLGPHLAANPGFQTSLSGSTARSTPTPRPVVNPGFAEGAPPDATGCSVAQSKGGTMAETPEETIRAAAQAYISGDEEALIGQLDDGVRVLGSEQRDKWNGREKAVQRLAPELERRRTLAKSVGGSLLEHLESPEVHQNGDMAWWSATGDLDVDGSYHRETSWTVILQYESYSEDAHEQTGGDWRIVHSHFSIHR